MIEERSANNHLEQKFLIVFKRIINPKRSDSLAFQKDASGSTHTSVKRNRIRSQFSKMQAECACYPRAEISRIRSSGFDSKRSLPISTGGRSLQESSFFVLRKKSGHKEATNLIKFFKKENRSVSEVGVE